MIKLPSFFYKRSLLGRIISTLLYIIPLAPIYFLVTWLRYRYGSVRFRTAHAKVICVGNITLGGTGKTPICIMIMDYLTQRDYQCCFLTKGYKRHSASNLYVKRGNPDNLTYKDVGDEALLLAKAGDVFVVNKRWILPPAIDKYDYIISDDGLLDPSLYYHKKILIIDGTRGMGNGYIFPAGPLRINLGAVLPKLDAVIVNHYTKETDNLAGYSDAIRANKIPIYHSKIELLQQPDNKAQYIAFAGLGNNERFFSTLRQTGYNVVKTFSYPDHHVYSENDLKYLLRLASSLKCSLITTEKDMVKIPPFYYNQIQVLPIRLALPAKEREEFVRGLLE